ncbi:MAG: hypothetical protein AABW58_03810 [Nanoarchaeota archaeon]
MNKKGFIRTIEAVIAIVILLGLVLTIFGDKEQEIKKTPDAVESSLNYITNEFLYNEELRNCVIASNSDGSCISSLSCREKVDSLLKTSTPPGYNYECEVCKTTRSCVSVDAPEDKSIYPKSAFLYKPGEADEIRIVRVYLFEKA